jgi:hypothetical protein
MHPLLENYEKYYGKKEKPKIPRIEDYEGEKTIADELKEIKEVYELPEEFKNNSGIVSTDPTKKFITTSNQTVSISTPNLRTFSSYDLYSINQSFLEIADKIKMNNAQVTNMEVTFDSRFGCDMKKLIFSVQVYDAP